MDLSPDPSQLSGDWAVLLPDRQATPEDRRRWVREVAVLEQLARQQLPFRVPAPLGAFPEGVCPVIVRQFVEGIPVDLRAGRMPSVRPAELVGSIAAAIHGIDLAGWPQRPPGGATRRAHVQEALRAFDELDGTEAQSAREWAEQHQPPDRAAVLLHGDLLGQNVLVSPEEAPAVIDWEYCRVGDPAFDLAIVTRGVRRPFQLARGPTVSDRLTQRPRPEVSILDLQPSSRHNRGRAGECRRAAPASADRRERGRIPRTGVPALGLRAAPGGGRS